MIPIVIELTVGKRTIIEKSIDKDGKEIIKSEEEKGSYAYVFADFEKENIIKNL